MWINTENEDDAPQELLEVGPWVHLTQCPVRDCRKNTSTQGHPPQTCSSGELLFVLTVCQHSVCDIHKEKKNVFNQTFPRLFSLDGQHQGRKSNRKTSQQFIAVGNQMSGYQIWTHPSISVSQFRLFVQCHKNNPRSSEHLQQVGRQGQQSRAEALSFQQQHEL